MASEWNSDMSAAPRDGTELLLCAMSDDYAGGSWIITGQWGTNTIFGQTGDWWADNAAVGCQLPFEPTHWRALPPAPTGDA